MTNDESDQLDFIWQKQKERERKDFGGYFFAKAFVHFSSLGHLIDANQLMNLSPNVLKLNESNFQSIFQKTYLINSKSFKKFYCKVAFFAKLRSIFVWSVYLMDYQVSFKSSAHLFIILFLQPFYSKVISRAVSMIRFVFFMLFLTFFKNKGGVWVKVQIFAYHKHQFTSQSGSKWFK